MQTTTLSLATQDSTTVTLTGTTLEVRTEVRGGGIGADAYLAELIGPCPTYTFAREFIRGEEQLSRSRGSGVITWRCEAARPGMLLELARYAKDSRHRARPNFILVTDDGLETLTRTKAAAFAAELPGDSDDPEILKAAALGDFGERAQARALRNPQCPEEVRVMGTMAR